MSIVSMGYDHAAYLVRLQHTFNQKAAGASALYDKFAAFTAIKIFAITTACVIAGTSSYTAWNGTATVTTTGTGDTIAGIKVSGTTTTTYGPYALNAAVGGANRIQISGTGAGSSTADGGLALNPGDTFHVIRGTDATAVQIVNFEYGLVPLANVSV